MRCINTNCNRTLLSYCKLQSIQITRSNIDITCDLCSNLSLLKMTVTILKIRLKTKGFSGGSKTWFG